MEEVEKESPLKVGDRIIFKSFSIRCEGTITRVGTRCVFVGDIMVFPFELIGVIKSVAPCSNSKM